MSWFVFAREWVVVHVESAAQQDGGYPVTAALLAAALLAYRDEKYGGRVEADDVRFTFTGAGPEMLGRLELRLPNPVAEYGAKDQAVTYASTLGTAAEIVERGAPRDKELRAYGTRRL